MGKVSSGRLLGHRESSWGGGGKGGGGEGRDLARRRGAGDGETKGRETSCASAGSDSVCVKKRSGSAVTDQGGFTNGDRITIGRGVHGGL